MLIIYIDIVLLVILLCLTVFACGYCFYRVHRLQQSGQMAILLRPTKVLFSHKREGDNKEQLRTVVAYQNPFTGDYCVHKSRVSPKGYVNSIQEPDSPDSGVSDEYEPLSIEPPRGLPHGPQMTSEETLLLQESLLYAQQNGGREALPQILEEPTKTPLYPEQDKNSVNKTWNWNYKEYQI